MLSNGNKSNCGFDEQIISYIYDEATNADRRKFEAHLVACSACTEEFASISNARLSVFEWQREAFPHLATPDIVIPSAAVERAIRKPVSTGFWQQLRGLFSGNGMPVAVAAALVVCLGIGFATIMFLSKSAPMTASDIRIDEPKLSTVVNQENPERIDDLVPTKSENLVETAASFPSVSRGIQPAKAVAARRPRPDRAITAGVSPRRFNQKTTQARRAPVLSNFEDNVDRSLRLADLFEDEIGSIR